MENKKKILIIEKNISIFTSFILIVYFFFGYLIDENTAGAGPYDFKLIWSNLQLFKEGIISNLGSLDYNDSRPPLSYIIHILINPLIIDQQSFRFSVLLISLIVPLLLFFSIKLNYKDLDNNLLLLLTLIITLSPFFRTNAYWGLGENYGMIFLLSSYLVLQKFKSTFKINSSFKNYFIIFFLCLSSSLCVYFDQKLIFIPAYIFFFLMNFKIELKYKLTVLLFFTIFALPFLFLINIWGSILPPDASLSRGVGRQFHIFHLGYCLTIIAFYIAPLLLFKKKGIKDFKDKLLTKNFSLILSLFLIYIFVILLFGNFQSLPIIGKGFIHKVLILTTENINIRFFLTIISFFIAFILIYIYFDNKYDLIIILFFLTLSIIVFPFQQEYLDPLVYILALTFFKTRLNFNLRKTYFLLAYFLIFSLVSKYYYQITIV